MSKSEPKHKYTFINPNTPQEVEKLLQKIIIEKLLFLHKNPQLAIS